MQCSQFLAGIICANESVWKNVRSPNIMMNHSREEDQLYFKKLDN